MSKLVDADERDRIRDELGTTFVVEAAAGTGKTSALIGRILSMLKSGTGQLASMVAVTFTEKAAGELKLRLRAGIDDERKDSSNDEERKLLDKALSQLELARIGTIHSFCADLLKERPVEAGVDPDFAVSPEIESKMLLEQAFDTWFQAALEDPGEGLRRYLARRTWKHGSGARAALIYAAGELVDKRDHPAPWRRDPFNRASRLDALIEEARRLGHLADEAKDPNNTLARCFRQLEVFVARIDSRESVSDRDYDWLEGQIVKLPKTVRWDQKGGCAKFYADGMLRADVLAQRDEMFEALEEFLSDAAADLAACLQQELQPIVATYEELKVQHGVLDFVDLLLCARDLVRDQSEVRRELQERFRHIFVDEFQDTDPLQAEIVILLSADDWQESSPTKVVPIPGKLFVVGDPKQSIYRFRRAEVAVYERVKRQLVAAGGEVLYLRTSFRSLPDIQRVVNVGLAEHMIEADDGSQARYVALESFREATTKAPSVVALPIPTPYSRSGNVTKGAVAECTPDAVASYIQWLIEESGWTVEDPSSGDQVAIASEHVCLLFRQFMNFGSDITRPYAKAMEARGLPHVLIGGRSYHEREEVIALRSTLNAIEWPDDQLSVYATLRGPYVALEDELLFLFKSKVGALNPLRPLSKEERAQHPDVAEALDILAELHKRRNRQPIADTVSQFLDATRAHAGVAIWPTGEQALANVLRTLEEARRYEGRGATSFRSFVEWFEDQAEKGLGAQAPIVEEGSAGVRVMTVHKSKGLEFPIVILCDPGCSRVKTRPSRYVDGDKGQWAFSLANCVPADLRDHEASVLAADNAEEVRVAYVAATRARDMLVIPACGDGSAEGWIDVLHPGLYPEIATRQRVASLDGLPEFGADSVLQRPHCGISDETVAPGRHDIGGSKIVWWDPAVLKLERPVGAGVRQQDLLVKDGNSTASDASIKAHDDWKCKREQAIASGAKATSIVQTVTQAARHVERVEKVDVAYTEASKSKRPRGRRFGTLVHAVLADVDLDAERPAIEKLAGLHGKLMGTSDEETVAATVSVLSALGHDLLVEAREAQSRGECHREWPMAQCKDDGSYVEGVADLVYKRQDGCWVVVDFKTDSRPGAEDQYHAQVQIYAEMLAVATKKNTSGLLLGV